MIRKYILLLLIAILALPASAQTWYLVGDFNGWSQTQNPFTYEEENDWYTLELDYFNGAFKVKNSDGAWYGNNAGQNDYKLTFYNGKYYLKNNDEGNCEATFDKDVPVIVRLKLNESGGQISLNVTPKYDWCVKGDINNWGKTFLTPVENKENEYSAAFDSFSGEFKIYNISAKTWLSIEKVSALNTPYEFKTSYGPNAKFEIPDCNGVVVNLTPVGTDKTAANVTFTANEDTPIPVETVWSFQIKDGPKFDFAPVEGETDVYSVEIGQSIKGGFKVVNNKGESYGMDPYTLDNYDSPFSVYSNNSNWATCNIDNSCNVIVTLTMGEIGDNYKQVKVTVAPTETAIAQDWALEASGVDAKQFVKVSDNIYTLDIENLNFSQFKEFWLHEKTNNRYYPSDGQVINFGKDLTCAQGSAHIRFDNRMSGQNVRLVLDTTEGVKLSAQHILTDNDVYFDVEGSDDYNYFFENHGDPLMYTYLVRHFDIADGTNFQVISGGKQYYLDATTAIEVGKTYTLTKQASDNYNLSFSGLNGKSLLFTVQKPYTEYEELADATIDLQVEVIDFSDWYVRASFNEWKGPEDPNDWRVFRKTAEEGIYTIDLNGFTGKLKVYNGTDNDHGKWYGAAYDAGSLKIDANPINLIPGNSDPDNGYVAISSSISADQPVTLRLDVTDPENPKLSVSAYDMDGAYVVGNFFDGLGWSVTRTDMKLDKVSTGNAYPRQYNGKFYFGAPTTYIKFVVNNVLYCCANPDYGKKDETMSDGEEYTPALSGDAYMLEPGMWEFDITEFKEIDDQGNEKVGIIVNPHSTTSMAYEFEVLKEGESQWITYPVKKVDNEYTTTVPTLKGQFRLRRHFYNSTESYTYGSTAELTDYTAFGDIENDYFTLSQATDHAVGSGNVDRKLRIVFDKIGDNYDQIKMAFAEAAPRVSFDPAEAYIPAGTQVKISCDVDGYTVYYKLNGSDETLTYTAETQLIARSDLKIEAWAEDASGNGGMAANHRTKTYKTYQTAPTKLYIHGSVNQSHFVYTQCVEADESNGGVHTFKNVHIAEMDGGFGHIVFSTWDGGKSAPAQAPMRRAAANQTVESAWSTLHENGDVYVPADNNKITSVGDELVEMNLRKAAANDNASMVMLPSTHFYDLTVDASNPDAPKLIVSNPEGGVQTGVEGLDASQAEAEYYNLQGVRVANPGPGIYLRRCGASVSKVVIR